MRRGWLGARFWTLWAATSSANLGDGLSLTAFPLLSIALTDDARLIALVNVGRFLPFVLLGLPLGLLVDRFDRRLLAIGAQLLRGSVIGVLTFIVATDRASIGLLVITAFVVGLGEVLTDSGVPAMIRGVVDVEQLEVANARLAAAQSATNLLVGPALGAALFVIDPAVPFAAVSVMFFIAAGFLVLLAGPFEPPPADDAHDHPFRQVTRGLRYVWGHEVLRPLALTVAVFAFVGEAGNAVFVLLATERLGLGEIGFGLLFSVDALASFVAAFFVTRLVAKVGHAGSMRLAMAMFATSALMLGLTQSIAVAVAAAVVSGISDPTWNVVSTTIRQRLVPDEVFGRMMTAYLFIAWGMQPAGAFLGGVVAEAFGPQWVYLLSAPIMMAMIVFARPLFAAVRRSMAPQ